MRLMKKLTALCVALVMLVCTAVGASAASFTDVSESSKYASAIDSMVALGLLKGYDDGSFRPDATITRAEFAAVMTRAIGMESLIGSASSTQLFEDMSTNGTPHWASGYVKIAYDKGIILGMGDGTFAPDNPVTYEQAVKMIVCALGYEVAANDRGGWPNGYIAQANELNITKGAEMTPTNGPAPRGLVAKLVYNALEVRIMERSANGSMSLTAKTMLKDMLKVYSYTNMIITEVDGVVSINPTSLNPSVGELVLEAGTDVAVYDYTGVTNSEAARKALGHYVSGYYKISDEDDEKRVLLSMNESSKNEEITIASDDIDRIVNKTLYYWIDKENDANPERVEIATTAKLIYNGVAYDYLTSSVSAERDLSYWLDPDSDGFIDGDVRLLDSGADGTYDSIFIDDYEVYVVKSPVRTTDSTYTNNYVVYDYYTTGKSIQIDPYDRLNNVAIYNAKTGADMNIEDLKSMNILSVAVSHDQTSFKCYVSTDAISGSVDSKSSDGKTYRINKKDYELTPEFKTVVADGKVSMDIGSSGTFYLDKDGRIAAANITAAQTGNYMYITAAGKYDISGENAAVEIIALSGAPTKPTKYKIADKVRINNGTYTDVDSILDALEQSAKLLDSNTGAGDAKYSQLAKIVINSSKEITSIITAATSGSSLDVGSNTDSGKLRIGQTSKEYLYSTGGGFESQVFINSSTQVLIVPTSRRDSAKYKRSTGTSYFTAGSKYTIEAYDMNTSANAKVVVVFGDEADITITSDTPACIVTGTSEVISSVTGERVYSIDVYENGVAKTYETENNSSEYALKVGDVARFGYNSNGQINNIDSQIDISNLVPAKKNGTVKDENGEYKFKSIFGTVYSLSPERLIVSPAFVDTTGEIPTLAQDDREGYAVTSSAAIYSVNTSLASPTVERVSDMNAIAEFGETSVNANASTVYAYSLLGELKMVVIYTR